MMSEQTKICTKCAQELPISSFYKSGCCGKFGVISICKKCSNAEGFYYRRLKEGLVTKIYLSQKRHSMLRGHSSPTYTRDELFAWLLNQPGFHVLYDKWVESGYDRWSIPSCDRISSLKSYSLDNLQIGTFKKNVDNESDEIMRGVIGRATSVIGTSKSTGISVKYISAREAMRKTGINNAKIGQCCLGHRKSAGSHTWRFAI